MFSVAVDTGPLYGSMTGVGRTVSGILTEFRNRTSQLDVVPYVVSRRAELSPGTRRLPIPAFLALQTWSRFDHPRADRHLVPAKVIHGTNYVVPPARLPRVVSVYDTWALRNPGSCSPMVNRSMRVLRRNIHSGAVVHTSSHATADELREFFPKAKIHVIHLGAPQFTGGKGESILSRTELSDLPLEEGAPYVLAVGTIERRKNFQRLIHAFSDTHAVRSGIRLVIAGSHGDDIDEVHSTIDRLRVEVRSQIVLLGRVSDLVLDALYSNATIVVYPSLDEGFGFPILEAMSHGVPVVGSNRGSIPEIAGDAAILVDPMDVEHMSFHIDQLLVDEELRGSLIRKGSLQCARFTWAATADSLIELYESLANDSSIGR